MYGVLGKKGLCRILKRWFIGRITGQNVQRLQIFAILASFLKGNLNASCIEECNAKCTVCDTTELIDDAIVY